MNDLNTVVYGVWWLVAREKEALKTLEQKRFQSNKGKSPSPCLRIPASKRGERNPEKNIHQTLDQLSATILARSETTAELPFSAC